MKIVRHTTHEGIKLSIHGVLSASCIAALRFALDATVAERSSSVELDVSSVELIDTVAIGAVIALFKRLREDDRRLVITGLTGQPKLIFEVLGLQRRLAIGTAA